MNHVALFTCASLDIRGWCTVKHRYLGYHVACPPWLIYWSKRGSLFSIDLIFRLGSGWVFPEEKKYKHFIMFQCMACACIRIWGDPGDQFLWLPWSVLPACCEFWLKLIVTFKWLRGDPGDWFPWSLL